MVLMLAAFGLAATLHPTISLADELPPTANTSRSVAAQGKWQKQATVFTASWLKGIYDGCPALTQIQPLRSNNNTYLSQTTLQRYRPLPAAAFKHLTCFSHNHWHRNLRSFL